MSREDDDLDAYFESARQRLSSNAGLFAQIKPKKQRKLSAQGEQVLRDLVDGLDPTRRFRTQSEHGGFVATVYALRRRGLIDSDDKPTDAGRAHVARARAVEEASKP